MRSSPFARGFAMLVCVASLSACASSREPVSLEHSVDAIWKVRAVTFRYSSPTTYYYCDTLQKRVGSILVAVGASGLMHIDAQCAAASLINEAQIKVVLGVPIEATRENVIAETTFDTRTVLIAQARNWELATPETVRRFRAVRRSISLSNLTNSDCELVAAMSEQVFPQLGIRLKNAPNCGGAVVLANVTADALMPLYSR